MHKFSLEESAEESSGVLIMILHKYIVGDLRGHRGLLEKLLDRIQPDEHANVIFVGSYVGPGHDSKGTVSRLIELKDKMPSTFYFLRGCYDLLFCEYLGSTEQWSNKQLWDSMYGNDAIMSYVQTNGGAKIVLPDGRISRASLPIPKRHLDFLEQLPTLYKDEDPPIVVSHTGAAAALEGCMKQVAYFGVPHVDDEMSMAMFRVPGKTSIFGHIPFKEPFIGPGLIGIDLGAGFGGKLGCYDAIEDRFHIVEVTRT
jgi:hypothetical protein